MGGSGRNGFALGLTVGLCLALVYFSWKVLFGSSDVSLSITEIVSVIGLLGLYIAWRSQKVSEGTLETTRKMAADTRETDTKQSRAYCELTEVTVRRVGSVALVAATVKNSGSVPAYDLKWQMEGTLASNTVPWAFKLKDYPATSVITLGGSCILSGALDDCPDLDFGALLILKISLNYDVRLRDEPRKTTNSTWVCMLGGSAGAVKCARAPQPGDHAD